MKRTRDWIKFVVMTGIAVVFAFGFASVVDVPGTTMAQQMRPVSLLTSQTERPAPIKAAQPLVDLGNAFTSVAEVVQPAVVFIAAETDGRRSGRGGQQLPFPFDRFFQDQPEPDARPRSGQGSGFVISSDGYIITNNHVVDGADRLRVTLFEDRTLRAEIVGQDPNTDIAVLKVNARNLPTVTLGNSDSVRVGEWVLAIGNPLGRQFSFTVTAGIVSGRGRLLPGLIPTGQNWTIQDFIQTDAAINPGNSGGPLVNISGQVIGINAAIASQTGFYSGYGFAIPVNLARHVADQLIATGRVTRAALGVQIRDADDVVAEFVGLDKVRGVEIVDYSSDDSPAKQAGLKQGDVIVELDGTEVEYTAQLQQLVGFKRPGEVAEITVRREGGEERTFRVRLTEADTEAEPRLARAEPEESNESGTLESRIGIRVQRFDERAAARLQLRGEDLQFGLSVTEVDPDGPARGRLLGTDPARGVIEVITHVGDTPVSSVRDLSNALRNLPAGRIVTLRVWRMVGNSSSSQLVRIRLQ